MALFKVQDSRLNLIEQLIRNQGIYKISSAVSHLGVDKIIALNQFNSAFATFIPAVHLDERPSVLFSKNHYRADQVLDYVYKREVGGGGVHHSIRSSVRPSRANDSIRGMPVRPSVRQSAGPEHFRKNVV